MKIFVLGNPLLEEDSLPIRIMPMLQKKFPGIEFIDNVDEIETEKNIIAIDVAEGIDKIEILDNVEKIVSDKIYSMHDFDFGQTLKLMKTCGKLKSVKVFCLPKNMKEKDAVIELTKLIPTLL